MVQPKVGLSPRLTAVFRQPSLYGDRDRRLLLTKEPGYDPTLGLQVLASGWRGQYPKPCVRCGDRLLPRERLAAENKFLAPHNGTRVSNFPYIRLSKDDES